MNEMNRRVLQENSKSFNWASKLFSKEKRNLIAQLYFFCRTLDDIADEKHKDNTGILMEFKNLIADGGQQNVREDHTEIYIEHIKV